MDSLSRVHFLYFKKASNCVRCLEGGEASAEGTERQRACKGPTRSEA